jgi:hypothetical protein
MSQQQADATIAPLVTEASAQANQQTEDARYAAGDLTRLEKLQGSGSILADTFTGGISDEAGWTQSNRYQEGGFGAARIAASAARDATIGLITAGAGSWVSAGGVIGDAALTVNYAGRGYLAYQSGTAIGNGAYDISDGHYLRGSAEVLLGGAGLVGTMTGPLAPEAATEEAFATRGLTRSTMEVVRC